MTQTDDYQTLAQQLDHAVANREKLPKFPQLNMNAAYKVQAAFTQMADGGLAGFKAGLTTPQLQEIFGLDAPLLGRLFNRGRLAKDSELPYVAGVGLECEMADEMDAP